ncbi:hypothetical protein D3C81_2231320 [compost metagenome]
MLAPVEVEIIFARQLVRSIGCQWGFRRVFVDREPFTIVAIYGCTGGEHHALDVGLAHSFTNVQGADEVALMRTHRIVN